MTDIRELLAGIEKRADNHHMAARGARMHEVPGDPNFSVRNWADKPHRLVYDLAGDTRRLVAALRAVLDLCDDRAAFVARYPGEADAISAAVVRRAITEALGGESIREAEARRYGEYMRTQPDLGA